jgi:hypothetical protein
MVLDPRFHFIGKLDGHYASDIGLETDVFATWDNSAAEGDWNVRLQGTEYTLTLPPQSVGEAMHRRRDGEDLVPGSAVPFRFRANTTISLCAGYFDQNYPPAFWNLRRNLGFSQIPQRDPGQRASEICYEMPYGIRGLIQNRNIRVSELQARLGRLAGVPDEPQGIQEDNPTYTIWAARKKDWEKQLQQITTRPAVLEPWLPQPSDSGSQTTTNQETQLHLTQDDGLRFVLRHPADTITSTAERKKYQPDLKWPVPKPPTVPNAPPEDNRAPDGALAGGFTWGFENLTTYRALWRQPWSTSGELTAPYFTALGGYGSQTARFDNNRTAIITVTEQGNVSSVAVERIGRLGRFRNKCKHVVIYRRTVAPSRQFEAQQYLFLNHPILRKYEEYIEFIEPLRDLTRKDGTAQQCGPVKACSVPGGRKALHRLTSTRGRRLIFLVLEQPRAPSFACTVWNPTRFLSIRQRIQTWTIILTRGRRCGPSTMPPFMPPPQRTLTQQAPTSTARLTPNSRSARTHHTTEFRRSLSWQFSVTHRST